MGIFSKPPSGSPEPPKSPELDGPIPVTVIDLSVRYDIYTARAFDDRLYEDVRIVGIKTFEQKDARFGTALLGGYLEIEARNGVRMMIPSMGIYMICQHGSLPEYKVLHDRNLGGDGWT